nr:RNA-directed DNA polymerase, eukaryota [Tanacetum cinerariifolium]
MVAISKEDEVQKISTSIFVTNFSEYAKAKDLWNVCKQYGHVVDAFIPSRRSKKGKRFGFIRFIRVLDVDRLVSNLCTIRIGDHRLYANVARFQRSSVPNNSKQTHQNRDPVFKNKEVNINSGHRADQTSYVHAVTGKAKSTEDCEPVMVLDEARLNHQEYSLGLLGKVKEFSILANVKVVLGSEGFSDIELNYMEGLWIMIGFKSEDTKAKFQSCVGAVSWHSLEAMVENTFNRIAAKWGKILYMENLDVGCFHSNRICILTTGKSNIFESFKIIHQGTIKEDFGGSDGEMERENNVSMVPDTEENVQVEVEGNDLKENNFDDPFNLYPLLIKKKNTEKSNNTESFQYPPGFTPCDVKAAGLDKNTTGINESSGVGGEKLDSVSVVSRNCKKVDIKTTRGSLLTVMEELIKVGKTMGYNMEGRMKNIEEIIEIQGVEEEKSSFKKINSTVSDYFVMIRGTWVCSGVKLLIISVYAPREFSETKMLWDYLGQVITKWNGDVIVMGDFNEVRYKNERYGSVFHAHGVDAFNSFISNANLQDIPLGGCAFTWCHKSASKMSKLDRFHMSEGLLSANPKFSTITLDRYLSDHRPIMLRESFHDYGPIPFRSFHYWFEIDGFEEMILKCWCISPAIEVNPMLKLMYKMKFLRKRICEWNGNATNGMLYKRREIIKVIQEVDKVDNMEAAQKAKIKWAIEGDENTKYYHGILNKKRNQLAIRGVLKDGIWIENSNLVKNLEGGVDCGVDKSLGPDGFTFGFIRRFWSLLEKDVVAAVKYFFTSGTFPKGCNASFISLISKIPDAKMIKDFRPISLIGSLYKIIAKILANHFVGVLGDIVSEVQSAFVADRQILDGLFILNEFFNQKDSLWAKVIQAIHEVDGRIGRDGKAGHASIWIARGGEEFERRISSVVCARVEGYVEELGWCLVKPSGGQVEVGSKWLGRLHSSLGAIVY